MPWRRPTLGEIATRIRTDIEALVGKFPTPGRMFDVLAILSSRLNHGAQGHLANVMATALINKCTDEAVLRWARVFNVPPRAGSKSSGDAQFSAPVYASVPVGTIVKAGDAEFVVLSSVWLLSIITVSIEAVEPGAAGNVATGESIVLQSPVPGVETEGLIDAGPSGAGTTGGTDVESVEQVRARLLRRYKNPPRGGADGDYVSWALEVPGVLRAWEYTARTTARTVDLLFVVEVEGDLNAWTIPNATQITAVQDYLNAKAPSTVTVTVSAPTAQSITLDITLAPDDANTRAAVESSLKQMYSREASPGGTIPRSVVLAAISDAAGETDHALNTAGDIVASSADHLPEHSGSTF